VNAVVIFFVLVEVASAIGLIIFVLLHSGRGAGVSEMFGGMMPAASSGSSIVERNLDRLTIAFAAVFMVSLIVLMVIYPA
jgi:preprotein translocase subunit SecG